jgi:hypothetical protein
MNGEGVHPIYSSREWQPEYLYLRGNPGRNIPVSGELPHSHLGFGLLRAEVREAGKAMVETLEGIREEIHGAAKKQPISKRDMALDIAKQLRSFEKIGSGSGTSSDPGSDISNSGAATTGVNDAGKTRCYCKIGYRGETTNRCYYCFCAESDL